MKKLCLILSAVLFFGLGAANAAGEAHICVKNKTTTFPGTLIKLCADSYSKGSTVYSGYCTKPKAKGNVLKVTIKPPQKATLHICFFFKCKTEKITATKSVYYNFTDSGNSKSYNYDLRKTSKTCR
jgi:hypothetical protein